MLGRILPLLKSGVIAISLCCGIAHAQAIPDVVYLSTVADGNMVNAGGTIDYSDEDILRYDIGAAEWEVYFDGSDVGLVVDVNAFTFLPDSSILLSTTAAVNVPGIGQVDDSDIVRFIPATTGSDTSGVFELYFDGSDVGLSAGGEDIHALAITGTGSLLISVSGSANVPG